MHEQSETIQLPSGQWVNVYGSALPLAGKQLPGTPSYKTVREAVAAAVARSEAHDAEHASCPHCSKEKENMDELKDLAIPRAYDAADPTLADGMRAGKIRNVPALGAKYTQPFQPENPAVRENYNDAMNKQKQMVRKLLNY